MVFSSPVFLFLFLPILLGAYFVLGARARNGLLLIASLLFYLLGEMTYIVVLLSSITANFFLGRSLERHADNKRAAQWLLVVAVTVNLGLLIAFKYANFLAENLNDLLALLSLGPIELGPVHLPLGISFFTFHALSYVIDVYRREVPALHSPKNFALYISFFPQSIAGPIIRYNDVAGQLADRTVTLESFAYGVKRFIVGLAKKMMIANTLAGPADGIFGLTGAELTPGLAWLGILCYSLQIYFDFSGYSDMAIGLAAMFGFRFRENFLYPYVAASITDFWRRWHISLSTWFRDYLYIPLGGNRHGPWRTYANLIIVFSLCGFWHGASWTFLFWGLFHGGFLVLERIGLGDRLQSAWRPLRHLYVLAVVMLGWVFFRAESLPQALALLQNLMGMPTGATTLYSVGLYWTWEVALMLAAGAIGSMPVVPLWTKYWGSQSISDTTRRSHRALAPRLAYAFLSLSALVFLLGVSAMLLAGGTYNPFIYFRF